MDVRFSSTESPSYSNSDVTRSSIPPFTSDGDSRDWLLDTLGEPLCRLDRLPVSLGLLIGIGGSLAAPPLPHHRAYGSVPRRFDRVRRSKDQFPLLFLYANPSFRSMQEGAEEYVLYNKRPCGLFPEASAMAAEHAPGDPSNRAPWSASFCSKGLPRRLLRPSL